MPIGDQPLFSEAVRHFWNTRNRQAQTQTASGARDQGLRGAVTGGRQMDGFANALRTLLADHGVPPGCVFTRSAMELPGFFRPTKQWDLIVIRGGRLVCAVELKSQVGPSFGNNFNNRTEEAMGTAVDIWTAYREGAFAPSPPPWLGYLLVLEDCPKSQEPVRVAEPHFPVFPVFHGASYARRYELFCQHLVRERHYNSACFILADPNKTNEPINYTEPSLELSADQFVRGILARVDAG